MQDFRFLKMGEVYRYGKNVYDKSPFLDGLRNFFYLTNKENCKAVKLDSGINPIGGISAPEGRRFPAICIRSSPHRAGSAEAPWEDFFDEDSGFIRYFGDNKPGRGSPEEADGNKALLEQHALHVSEKEEERMRAVPILAFQAVKIDGRIKGNLKFCGLCLLERVERVTQYDSSRKEYFTNYVFSLCVLSTSKEDECFDWRWINERRNSLVTLKEANQNAPNAWKVWVKKGTEKKNYYQRNVLKRDVVKKRDRVLSRNSKEFQILHRIYKFYKRKEHDFEFLAAHIVSRIFKSQGHTYLQGWVSEKSGDGGVDFVGRLDLIGGLSRVKVIVLGQAKCETLNKSTGGLHIARTVARLKRGWVGAYVTTGIFSETVQEEILEDKYPLLLVDGKKVAEEVLAWISEKGQDVGDLENFLQDVESMKRQERKRPDDILFFISGHE